MSDKYGPSHDWSTPDEIDETELFNGGLICKACFDRLSQATGHDEEEASTSSTEAYTPPPSPNRSPSRMDNNKVGEPPRKKVPGRYHNRTHEL